MIQSKAAAASLQDHHAALQSTLLDLGHDITDRLETQSKQIRSKESAIKDVGSKMRAITDDIDAANSRATYLDTVDLEKQEGFDVQAAFLHVRKSIDVTPNFQFNLKTKFPIREYESYLNVHSKWKSVTCERGGYSFQGFVK